MISSIASLALVEGLLSSTPGSYVSLHKENATTVQVAYQQASFYVTCWDDTTIRLSALEKDAVDQDRYPGTAIVIGKEVAPSSLETSEAGDSVTVTCNYKDVKNEVSFEKSSGKVSYTFPNAKVEESNPLSWNPSNWQRSISFEDNTGYYGGGMQLGWDFKGSLINITASEQTKSPFVIALNHETGLGWGTYYNTWFHGTYDYRGSSLTHSHNQKKGLIFDSFVVAGSIKDILASYARATGYPFLPPSYGLQMGDSDCYHNKRHDWNSMSVVSMVDNILEKNIPFGWVQYDDGYGCGIDDHPSGKEGTVHEKVPMNLKVANEVGAQLSERNIVSGLWSSSGLQNFSLLVKDAKIRIAKTDVGWVGPGYDMNQDALNQVTNGIVENSDSRPFIWTCVGWAGTQRYAVMWAGDDSGGSPYIQNQLQWYLNGYAAGMAHINGDIDGILSGSPPTYIREIQFKSFMTVLMTMSGWASSDRQPTAYGAFVEAITRQYLNIKSQLFPYQYTLSKVASTTGYPPVTPLLFEFPKDKSLATWDGKNVNAPVVTQFMSGPSLLVSVDVTRAANDYGPNTQEIYFPEGNWYSFWNDSLVTGPQTKTVVVQLAEIPVYVREGSIIPLWSVPEQQVSSYNMSENTLEFHIYYPWTGKASPISYELYEDDGVTRSENSLHTTISVRQTEKGYEGEISGKLGQNGQAPSNIGSKRRFLLVFHATGKKANNNSTATYGSASLPFYHSQPSLIFANGTSDGGFAEINSFDPWKPTSKLLTPEIDPVSEQSFSLHY